MAALAWEFPSLRNQFAEHLGDNFGTIIPHVLMGDYEALAEDLVESDPDQLRRFLAFLERAMDDEDEGVQNVIDVSFVEQLPYPDQAHATIRDMLGPRLQSLLRHGL